MSIKRFSIELTPKIIAKNGKRIQALLSPGTRVFIPHLASTTYHDVIDAAQFIKELDMTPVPHFAARRFESYAQLDDALFILQERVQVREALIISGDYEVATSAGPRNTVELVRSGLLQRCGIRSVFVAGFPEPRDGQTFPQEADMLKEKIRACQEGGIALSVVTQFCSDTRMLQPWLRWYKSTDWTSAITSLHVGLAGPVTAERLRRFARQLGVNEKGIKLNDAVKVVPDEQVEAVRAIDPDSMLHFYPFGGLEATVEWLRHQDKFNDAQAI
mmetsp:Transcript_2998/g.9181  ORF Transcript_2998/g.9181 Transcript_2998/m.9181 type:complete len:273 (-) Transcript_2998:593-1411(-)